jgi:homoserine dehydrogenase
MVGETLYYGPGAGGDATASAVVANIIDIARSGKRSPMLGFNKPLEQGLKLKTKDEIVSKYYLRMGVEDKPGVLSSVTKMFADNDISIETVLQRPCVNGDANLLFATHHAVEKNIQGIIKALDDASFVKSTPSMIRIEA